ncbi:hypothetical protein R3P38DRAFT_2780767 [Favolaschia claudopus]|uniref:Uncharacterized protein n=1 Tax=Favolaschia claudopus TaxID=2862362 RepID=A0AAW0B6Q1_9AGAR
MCKLVPAQKPVHDFLDSRKARRLFSRAKNVLASVCGGKPSSIPPHPKACTSLRVERCGCGIKRALRTSHRCLKRAESAHSSAAEGGRPESSASDHATRSTESTQLDIPEGVREINTTVASRKSSNDTMSVGVVAHNAKHQQTAPTDESNRDLRVHIDAASLTRHLERVGFVLRSRCGGVERAGRAGNKAQFSEGSACADDAVGLEGEVAAAIGAREGR